MATLWNPTTATPITTSPEYMQAIAGYRRMPLEALRKQIARLAEALPPLIRVSGESTNPKFELNENGTVRIVLGGVAINTAHRNLALAEEICRKGIEQVNGDLEITDLHWQAAIQAAIETDWVYRHMREEALKGCLKISESRFSRTSLFVTTPPSLPRDREELLSEREKLSRRIEVLTTLLKVLPLAGLKRDRNYYTLKLGTTFHLLLPKTFGSFIEAGYYRQKLLQESGEEKAKLTQRLEEVERALHQLGDWEQL